MITECARSTLSVVNERYWRAEGLVAMMTSKEIHDLVENYIGSDCGYLNHFSYAKHEEFYLRYCDIDVDVPAYRKTAGTTRKAFIAILKDLPPKDQARVIRGVFEMVPPPSEITDETSRRKTALHSYLISVAIRLESDGHVQLPEIVQTSEVVLEAIKDAEMLLKNRGPISALDRVHTALHGYLRKLCADHGASVANDSSLMVLFKAVREQVPEFCATVPHDAEAKRVFGTMAATLDSLNTIRNRATLAHPNDLRLQEPEAMLYINFSRALIAYMEAKLRN